MGKGSRARRVIRELQKMLEPSGISRIPYYFMVPRQSFMSSYGKEQRVLAVNKTAAGAHDRQLIEQWVCMFDKQAFLASTTEPLLD